MQLGRHAIGDQRHRSRRARHDAPFANITGRTGSNAGFAASIPRYSSRISTNWPKWAASQCPRAPSPCSRIVSSARCADAEVGHRHELGPAGNRGARRLCARRPDEQVALAELAQRGAPDLARSSDTGGRSWRNPAAAGRCRPRPSTAPRRARARRCLSHLRAPCPPGARET